MFILGNFKLYLLIAVLLTTILGAAFYYYNNTQKTIRVLEHNNSKLIIAIKTQKETTTAIQKNFEVQTAELLNLGIINQELQKDKNALNSIIFGHDWEKLSREKPTLIEKRINSGTKKLFDSFTIITTD